MRFILIALCAVSVLACASGSALGFGNERVCIIDTTFSAAAGADTITFVPYSADRIFIANGWTIKLNSTIDTAWVRVEFKYPQSETDSGYSQYILDTKAAPQFMGRLDTLAVYLGANHPAMRFRGILAGGVSSPPSFGYGDLDAILNDTLSVSVKDTIYVQDCRLWAYGAPHYGSATVSGTKVDSIAGDSTAWHKPVGRVVVATDAAVYMNWNGPTAGDSLATGTKALLMANERFVLDDVDLWKFWFVKYTTSAGVRYWTWPAGPQRAAPE